MQCYSDLILLSLVNAEKARAARLRWSFHDADVDLEKTAWVMPLGISEIKTPSAISLPQLDL
jgi:hypothetical protein